MAQVEPALLSRHGSDQANLAYVVSAIQSIRGEGLKTGLVSATPGLNSDLFPVSKELFDAVSLIIICVKTILLLVKSMSCM